jgi:putative SOS response-associated peptidase YedK
MAAIGSTPFERGDEAEGFLIVTSAADKGLVDIHDRRPLVLSPEAARMDAPDIGKEAEEIAAEVQCRPTSLSGTPYRAPWEIQIIKDRVNKSLFDNPD